MNAVSILKTNAFREFVLFCGVGTIGFIVDAGLIQLLSGELGWNPYAARVLTYLCAATVTWTLNRTITFRQAHRTNWRAQWSRYVIVNAVGAGINYLAFAGTLVMSDVARVYPALAVAVGSIVGLIFNFSLSKMLVFKSVGTAGAERKL